MSTLLKEYAVFLLISDKVFFKTESFARVKGDSFVTVKRSVS